jgi:preprotein translocase subunit SecY
MLSAFVNTFKIAELRQRILFTFGLIFICRLIAAVPLPGVDAVAIRSFFDAQGSAEGGLLGMFNLFSGGALLQCSIGSLGIMPYISASIIIQLMTAVIPHLEKLAREGDVGRQKITQYTRYLTVVLCLVQGFAMAVALQSGRYFGIPAEVVRIPGPGFILLSIMAILTGTLLLMWIGEQITDRGIGNGISLIITVNIVNSLPLAIKTLADKLTPVDGIAEIGPFHLILLVALIFFVTLGVVAVTQAQQKGFLPYQWAQEAAGSFPGSGWYVFSFGLMILFFSYFWVATQFNPIQIADDLKKRGGYIPGIRPGRPTAEYLDRTMTRLTLAGAIFLTVIAVMPNILTAQFNVPFIVSSFFGGTSLLIIVGVMLDTMRQIESHLLMRHYDGFLKKGKLRGRK